MEAFLVSAGAVALAEMGDKTQLLALTLAARWRKPLPICLGILVATLLNHAAAGWAGALIAQLLSPGQLRLAVGLSFIAMAAWTLIPDKLSDDPRPINRLGVFAATAIAFFIVEIGDKTQIATVALAARYPDLLAVVAGTTLGMMAANVPVVLAGNFAAERLPLKALRIGAAVLFAILGVAALLSFFSG